MTLRVSDLQSDSDLDSIRNSCDVFLSHRNLNIVKNTSIICWHFWEERRVELSTNKVPSISLLHFTLQILRNTLQIPYKWYANTFKCIITNTLKTRDIFLMKGAAAAVVERSMWHRIPLLRTTRSNWSNCARLLKILNKYLSNILQMLYKYFAIS